MLKSSLSELSELSSQRGRQETKGDRAPSLDSEMTKGDRAPSLDSEMTKGDREPSTVSYMNVKIGTMRQKETENRRRSPCLPFPVLTKKLLLMKQFCAI